MIGPPAGSYHPIGGTSIGHFHNGIRGWNDHGPVNEIIFPSALYNLDRKLEEQKAPGYTLVRISGGVMKLRYKPVGIDDAAIKELPLAQQAN